MRITSIKVRTSCSLASRWGSEYNMTPKSFSKPTEIEAKHPNVDSLEKIMQDYSDDSTILDQKDWPRGMAPTGIRNTPAKSDTGSKAKHPIKSMPKV